MRELAGDITTSMCRATVARIGCSIRRAAQDTSTQIHFAPTEECTGEPVQMHIEPIPPTLQGTTHVEQKTKWATMLE